LQNWAAGNYSPAPYTTSDIKYIANIGLENAASTRIRGVDLTPRYIGPDTPYGRFRADLDASYYIEYKQQITSGSPTLDIDNTTYNPLRFRAKTNIGWEKSGWAVNTRVNFANAYQNTVDPSCPSGCAIGSWTTVDIGLSYAVPNRGDASWLSGSRLAIIATNIFDRPPPFVSTGSSANFGYDPVNASPLMRSISITFAKRWGPEGQR
jgi:iron complex outermembrane recepter protein